MCETKMSVQLEQIFEKINHEVSTLHVYLQLYDQVFGSESVIDVVNDSAKFFFAMNQYLFIDNIILSVSRLLDPAKSGSFENISLYQLFNQVKRDENTSDALIDPLKTLLEEIQNLAASFKKHRNKRIAHLDHQTYQNKSAEFLPEISKNNLDELINHIDKFMNEIIQHYHGAHRGYYIILPSQSDGSALIHNLIKAQAYMELEDDEIIEKNYWMSIYPDLP